MQLITTAEKQTQISGQFSSIQYIFIKHLPSTMQQQRQGRSSFKLKKSIFQVEGKKKKRRQVILIENRA